MMAQQKENKPGQESGGSGERDNQPQRRDQTNPDKAIAIASRRRVRATVKSAKIRHNPANVRTPRVAPTNGVTAAVLSNWIFRAVEMPAALFLCLG